MNWINGFALLSPKYTQKTEKSLTLLSNFSIFEISKETMTLEKYFSYKPTSQSLKQDLHFAY